MTAAREQKKEKKKKENAEKEADVEEIFESQLKRLNKEYKKSKTKFYATVTNVDTGLAEYIKLDDNSKTPCNPNGCFGSLKNMNAKILFLCISSFV